MQQPVILAERPVHGILGHFGAKHWGLLIGTTWYELQPRQGQDKSITEPLIYVGASASTQAKYDTWEHTWRVGFTLASPYEVEQMIEEWTKANPTYHLTQKNCQHFVNFLLRRLGLPTRRQQQLV